MKLVPMAAAAVAFSAVASAAAAQDGPQLYGTIGYSETDIVGVKMGQVEVRVGDRIDRYVGVEVEAAAGVKDGKVGGASFNLEHKFAGYVVGYIPLTDHLDLLARVGYGTMRLKAKGGGGSLSADGNGCIYGLGIQYYFDDANGLRLDYTRLDTSGDAYAWALSYSRKF